MMKSNVAALTAILLALTPVSPAFAQNEAIANVAVPTDPVPVDPAATTTPAAPAEPTVAVPEPAVTTVPVAVPVATSETLPDPAQNPYANSYNEFLPLEEEKDEAFDHWGLLGLLGLLGLFGLVGRRERVVYVERAETIVPPRA